MGRFELRLAPSAERTPARLPESVAAAIVEFVTGALLDEPSRVGRRLRRELAEYHVARRGDYRVIYRIDESAATVRVVRIDHRMDVYRPRQTRDSAHSAADTRSRAAQRGRPAHHSGRPS
ncbi:MAG: type II toxin-antitoxin system RelE/ParE family toxin [Actinobacteria bacterium]|nr:type II toxin-antitoxin system RelE/ParE family toxin [Actinomycetota bacterium]